MVKIMTMVGEIEVDDNTDVSPCFPLCWQFDLAAPLVVLFAYTRPL